MFPATTFKGIVKLIGHAGVGHTCAACKRSDGYLRGNVNRWVIKYSPQLEDAFHRCKWPVQVSWRMDETYIKVKGEWCYLYRAVDKQDQTIDFLLTEHRDQEAALRFLKQAMRRHGMPEKITIDGSDANEAAIKRYNEEHGTNIIIRQVKYLNNIIEQDYRAVKRVTRPMLGFKSFEAAQSTLLERGITCPKTPTYKNCDTPLRACRRVAGRAGGVAPKGRLNFLSARGEEGGGDPLLPTGPLLTAFSGRRP